MSVDEIFLKYEEKISTIGFQLRKFLLAHLENIIEQPDLSANIIAYNYGTGYKTLICTIIPSKKRIKPGFYKGSELPDPHHLLTGTGKVHKYVEISSKQIINEPAY